VISLKRVLVATDFSETADVAMTYGRALAQLFGATLHVLHVAEDIYVRVNRDAYGTVAPGLHQEIEEAARARLAELVKDDDPDPLPTRAVVITATTVAPAIVQFARDERIDLIVLGTHGRGSLIQLLMGSVAELVVRTAPCPVLTVHRPGHNFVTPDTPTLYKPADAA
jgi:nucleotide-binding universal stress UspA family protein